MVGGFGPDMSGEFLTFSGIQLTWFGINLTWFGVEPVGPIWTSPFVSGIEPADVWTWAVGPGASATTPGAIRQLTQAKGRVVTWRVAGHAFAQFSLDGRSDEAGEIAEHESDLWVYRNGLLLFRGRVVSANDDIDATSHRTQFNAVDYRGMLTLAATVEPPVPTFAAVDQGQIPWELIEDWQALAGGDWGITEGVGGTAGVNRDETDITAGSPVGEVIDRLADRDGGFEWEISELLELNRWHPTRGSDNGVVLDYGGLLSGISRGSAQFANAAVVTGSNITAPEVAATATVGTDQRGRWTVAQGYPSVKIQDTLAAKAQWLVDQASVVEHAWTARVTSGRWRGRTHTWIGDTVQLRVSSGRIDVAAAHRIVELQAVCGDHGSESITFGLVAAP